MHTNAPGNHNKEKRGEARRAELRNHRVEIKFTGEPIYQFKVTDVSSKGAGVIVNTNSGFLKIIEVGQVIDVNFISPHGTEPSGLHTAQIKHISIADTAPYKGLMQVGIQIMPRLDQDESG